MTTWKRGLAFAAWLFALASMRAAFPELIVGKEIIDAIEQDATGRVWGLVRTKTPLPPSPNPDGTFSERADFTMPALATWEGDGWQPVAFHVPSNLDQEAALLGLQLLTDGAVMGVWDRFDSTLAVSRHLGDQSEVVGNVTVSRRYYRQVLLDAKGRLWVVDKQTVQHIGKDGAPEWSHEFAKQDYFQSAPELPMTDVTYKPPEVFEDLSGRVWAWGKSWPSSTDSTLRGIWELDGERVNDHSEIPGLPSQPLMFLAPKDDHVLWAGVLGEGLYELDTQAFVAKRVTEPGLNAFRFVEQVTRVGDDWYVVASPARYANTALNRDNTLWRQKDGGWQSILAGLDYWPQIFRAGGARPLVMTSGGLWIGTERNALWFVPADGQAPVHIDWHNGLPGAGIIGLFRLDESRGGPSAEESLLGVFMNRDYYQYMAFHASAAELLKTLPTAPNLAPVDTLLAPVQDARKHLWTVRKGSRAALSEWDGGAWKEYLMPENAKPGWLVRIFVDSLQRIWSLERPEGKNPYRSLQNGAVNIFDPSSGKWERHATYLDALKAQRQTKDFGFETWRAPRPVFSKDRRIAVCMDWRGPVHYLKGSEWRSFPTGEFKSTRFAGLFFDAEGRLCVNTYREPRDSPRRQEFTFVMQKNETWEENDRISGTPATLLGEYPQVMKQKGWAALEALRSHAVVEDANGLLWYWYIENGQLYKRGLGISAPQFMPGEAHPFLAEYLVEEALLDPEGNMFLVTSSRSSFYLTPREPLPHTEAVIKEKGLDSARITLRSNISSGISFIWRLDNGDWSAPQRDTGVYLADLIGGEHRFEAVALDEFLQTDRSPAVLQLALDANPEEQIRQWVEQLRDPEYEKRKEAVAKLARYGALALPALQKARENASDDLRWWIDAAGTKVGDRRP
jgi:hypothetical protein